MTIRTRPIALTGCDEDDDRRYSAEAGIHLHLLKPADPRVVIGVLRRFSGSAAIRAER